MMTLAIGDIHGCHTALQTMLDLVQPSCDDLIITLGDYVDRGPDSRRVIDTLLELRQSHHLVTLMGNHEIQLLRAFDAEHHRQRFLSDLCGGRDTLANYGGRLEDISDEHLTFMREAELMHETDTHIFVHGGVDPSLPLADQDPEVLYYQRFGQVEPHCSGKIVVCGHTVQGDLPTHLGHAICIDTCAYGGGWLTALDTESGRCWQTNQAGQSRSIDLV